MGREGRLYAKPGVLLPGHTVATSAEQAPPRDSHLAQPCEANDQ